MAANCKNAGMVELGIKDEDDLTNNEEDDSNIESEEDVERKMPEK
jgi:hypothetical protein